MEESRVPTKDVPFFKTESNAYKPGGGFYVFYVVSNGADGVRVGLLPGAAVWRREKVDLVGDTIHDLYF